MTAHLMNRISRGLAGRLGLGPLDGPPPLVLVAHGSRDPRALETVRALLDRVRARRPGLPVRLGHIELNAPLLPDTLAALDTPEAVLVPLLFSPGFHIKQDIPDMAAASRVHTRLAAPLGPHPLLIDALHARLTEAGWQAPRTACARRETAVILAAAGSRDPESAQHTRHIADRLAERLGVPVVPAYACAATPTVDEAIRTLGTAGRHRIAIASCFTAPGRFASECAKKAPWLASAPLGAHAKMADLILHRYDQALQSAAVGHAA
ncbi:sirohydrochlorin chelatase [Streptomyces sp. enrichment culture]|uniref:sirohydrochlorin chelatase n=1 Tax=Streptomyces sp. enrichment culture TaxID=1795815 RepID=UPI003F57365A